MKRNFLLFVVLGTLFSAPVFAAHDLPEAGLQFRIQNVTSKLYLTADPDWSPASEWDSRSDSLKWKTGGWNLVFLDSLYTVPVVQEYPLAYQNREPETITLSTTPDKQIFTLINPDPNDPDIWAIQTANGQYLSIDRRNAWDVTLSPDADNSGAQFFFSAQGSGIYLLRFVSEVANHYLAADGATPGIKIGQYSDGWEYATRSFVYHNKPVEKAMFYFEQVGGELKDATLKSLTVSAGKLSPTFRETTTNYKVSVGNNISTITITATATQAVATVEGAGEKALTVGENTFEIIVTSANEEVKKTYTVVVTRLSESAIPDVKANKNLSVLVNNGVLTVNVANGTPLAIYNLTGSKVLETKLQGSVNINHLNAGVYIVATPNGEKAKFIKQ
ncbi:MAG: hypothetical protein EZS26_001972 [Candidatus Ordinivivax streblomastigis]|uniref:Cadherin-like beta-sandwich-like domain-containing protein n=1 Tax=Candidatus Ordinivivax streblomastigis TaxID=2540710 RepID=A0A5M8P063_9BACT|nr:MAG: hypothetical protein EZS26_001972 [Candidatus Ordinivivax streblomastigis]